MGERVVIDPDENVARATRQVREDGTSTVVTLPPQLLDTAGLEPGDDVVLEGDLDTGVIRVRAVGGDEDAE